MTNKDLFLAALNGAATKRPPAFEQSFASDVASQILGRPAHTGGGMLDYQVALAACRGGEALRELLEQVEEDLLSLARCLHWSAIRRPPALPLPERPLALARIGDYEFLFGDPDGDWQVLHYDPTACTMAIARQARPRGWCGREEIKQLVDAAWHDAERWPFDEGRALEAIIRRWMALCGDEFALAVVAAWLFVPLDEKWLTACILAPELVAEYLDVQIEVGLQALDVCSNHGVPMVVAGGDLASSRGLMYSPAFFRDVVLPRYKRLIAHARSVGVCYEFRSDGNLWPLADMIFDEAMAPAYGEIDYDAGMYIPDLQDRFPELVCVGNVSCALLRNGSESEVRTSVRNLMERALPRGRWILASSNTVLPGTPARNVIAMLEEASVL